MEKITVRGPKYGLLFNNKSKILIKHILPNENGWYKDIMET